LIIFGKSSVVFADFFSHNLAGTIGRTTLNIARKAESAKVAS
jgi:hypothetical protein